MIVCWPWATDKNILARSKVREVLDKGVERINSRIEKVKGIKKIRNSLIKGLVSTCETFLVLLPFNNFNIINFFNNSLVMFLNIYFSLLCMLISWFDENNWKFWYYFLIHFICHFETKFFIHNICHFYILTKN